MMNLTKTLPYLLMLLLFAPSAAAQTETRVMVRAVAKDAKIIGSNVGGARIVIQDATSGAVLAEGIQEGSTGDTKKIVTDPVARDEAIYDTEGAAGFMASLQLREPALVDITAYGPLGTPQRLVHATKRMLLVPGKHVTGNGIILELNGFTVRLLEPSATTVIHAGGVLEVTTHVSMLCGCPTEPGGLWDADDIDVVARIVREGEVIREAPLDYAGEESTYSGRLDVPGAGAYALQVLASEPAEGNFGMAEQSLVVTP